jgi:hypothetical protein
MKNRISFFDLIVMLCLCVWALLGSALFYQFGNSLSAGSVDQTTNETKKERVAIGASAQKIHVDWNGIYLEDAKVFKQDRPVVIGFCSDGTLRWGYAPDDKEKVKQIADDLKTSDPD